MSGLLDQVPDLEAGAIPYDLTWRSAQRGPGTRVLVARCPESIGPVLMPSHMAGAIGLIETPEGTWHGPLFKFDADHPAELLELVTTRALEAARETYARHAERTP